MNQIIQAKYPFKFFPEQAFHYEQVINMIVDLYMDYGEYYTDEPVISTGRLASAGLYFFKVGAFARIVELGEEYNQNGMFGDDFSGYIRHLADSHGAAVDYMRMVEEFDEMGFLFPLDIKMSEQFKEDIARALEMRSVFYLDADMSLDGVAYFFPKELGSPYSKENVGTILRNIPIVRVW